MPPDPFRILGLPRRFRLDPAAIESAYLAAIASSHPDLTQDPDAGAIADASALNDARATLIDSEKRANLLHAALGGPTAAQSRDLPDGFLMQIMTTRQQVEAAIESRDDARRDQWRQWALEQRAWYEDRAARVLDADDPDPAALADLRPILNAWRYIERLIEQLDPGYDPNQADFA